MKRIFFSSIPLLLLLFQNSFAQIADTSFQTESRKSLEMVEIQNERLNLPFIKENRSVLILDSNTIRSLPINSINELLSFVAGVDMRQRAPWGGQADVTIDGSTFEQSLILVNGIKIIDPQTGHNTLNLPFALEAIERVEILKGPAAGKYGINALSGVINIITKQPAQSELFLKLHSGSSFLRDSISNKLYGALGVDFSSAFHTGKVNNFLAVSSVQSSGYRYNTAMNNNKLYYQNKIAISENNSLSFMGGIVANEFGAHGFYAAPGDIESTEKVKTVMTALKGDFMLDDNWFLNAYFNYRYNEDDYIYTQKIPSAYRNQHYSNSYSLSLNSTLLLNTSNILNFGLEYINDMINSNSLGDRERNNFGLFSDYTYNRNKFKTQLAVYLNYGDVFGWNFLPSFDIGYRLHPDLRIYANTGIGARIPSYTDLYYHGPLNIGNSALQPEKAIYAESGLDYRKNGFDASIRYFYRNTQNMIDWVKDSLHLPWQTQNYSQLNTQGFSFNSNYSDKISFISEEIDWNAGLAYTWLYSNQATSNLKDFAFSNYALENLRHQLILRLSGSYRNYFGLSFTARYEERVNYKDYLILDASARFNFKRNVIELMLNNLTNVTYIQAGAVPMPGRWYSLALSCKL